MLQAYAANSSEEEEEEEPQDGEYYEEEVFDEELVDDVDGFIEVDEDGNEYYVQYVDDEEGEEEYDELDKDEECYDEEEEKNYYVDDDENFGPEPNYEDPVHQQQQVEQQQIDVPQKLAVLDAAEPSLPQGERAPESSTTPLLGGARDSYAPLPEEKTAEKENGGKKKTRRGSLIFKKLIRRGSKSKGINPKSKQTKQKDATVNKENHDSNLAKDKQNPSKKRLSFRRNKQKEKETETPKDKKSDPSTHAAAVSIRAAEAKAIAANPDAFATATKAKSGVYTVITTEDFGGNGRAPKTLKEESGPAPPTLGNVRFTTKVTIKNVTDKRGCRKRITTSVKTWQVTPTNPVIVPEKRTKKPAAVSLYGKPATTWEKPIWTQKNVLRPTGAGDTLKGGSDIAAPITTAPNNRPNRGQFSFIVEK